MSLKLMYITNRPDVALIAEKAGVDRIFVDMEYIGKDKRQAGLDSVKNHHTVDDVKTLKKILSKSELLVRVNPMHEATAEYVSSEQEIQSVIAEGADIIMLPYFKTDAEVKRFIQIVNCRAKVLLLMETPESVELVDQILAIPGIDEIHIGLNDLSLGYGKKFMFELLADGTVERLCLEFKLAGIPYGFGGVAAIGSGTLPAEAIIREHYRLGSSMVILSRSFCNVKEDTKISDVQETFIKGVRAIREFEKEVSFYSNYFVTNQRLIKEKVNDITNAMTKMKA